MHISFTGGKKVIADYHGYTIETDQPVAAGGEGSAPSPFDLFLVSIGTCAGFYVLSFCQQRGIPTHPISLDLETESDAASHLISRISITINLPADFPAQYREAVVKAAETCSVKKHLQHPPAISIQTR